MANEPYIDEHPDEARARRLTTRALFLVMLPLLTVGGCPVGLLRESQEILVGSFWLWVASCIGSFVGGVIAVRVGRLRPSRRRKWVGRLGFAMPFITGLVGFAAGIALIPFGRGRALRRQGRARLPDDAANHHWTDDVPQPWRVAPADRDAVAAGWRAMAATEAASIASFSSLSNQLLAVGAPSTLIEMAHRDAIDEIVHARLCYDVARDLDGAALGANAFAAAALPLDHAPTLASLALECLRESCILEAASAKAAAALAARSTEGRLTGVLRTIAEDEARHAAHGWLMLEWLQQALGEDPGFGPVLIDLRRSVPRAVVDHERFETLGLAGPALWERCVREATDEAETRLQGPLAEAA